MTLLEWTIKIFLVETLGYRDSSECIIKQSLLHTTVQDHSAMLLFPLAQVQMVSYKSQITNTFPQ